VHKISIPFETGETAAPIGAMPGCFRVGWRHGLLDEVRKARDVGVNQVVLFPVVPNALKVRLQKSRDIIPSF
jgi:delta-aminolevulinic acid dehydratase/porphobilinogen synthase